jgi:hypothetical protein
MLLLDSCGDDHTISEVEEAICALEIAVFGVVAPLVWRKFTDVSEVLAAYIFRMPM